MRVEAQSIIIIRAQSGGQDPDSASIHSQSYSHMPTQLLLKLEVDQWDRHNTNA